MLLGLLLGIFFINISDCLFYEFENLKYHTQVSIHAARSGQKVRKITGIEPMPGSEEERIVITSNDSRIRIYNLKDKGVHRKFKGFDNRTRTAHIKATVSEDGKYIICGYACFFTIGQMINMCFYGIRIMSLKIYTPLSETVC